MNKPRKVPVTGVIDVGSGFMELKIVQLTEDGRFQVLEDVVKSLAIGRDTFSLGKLSPAMVDEICNVLSGFRQLLRDYHVRVFRAVATSAVREAKNRDYVLDQIQVRTGISLEVLHNSEERYLTQLAVRHVIPEYTKLKTAGLLTMDIGSGSIQIAAYDDSGLVYNQNIRLGSLRIRQLLSSVEENSLQFPKVLEEYIISHIDQLKRQNVKENYHFLIATGGEMEMVRRLCPGKEADLDIASIDRDQFDALYETMLYKSSRAIADEYGLEYERAEMLIPTMMLLKTFWKMTESQKLYCPYAGLLDGILWELNEQYGMKQEEENLDHEILSYARVLAEQYHYDKDHVADVDGKAMMIFDHLARPQRLGVRHRLLLRTAILLHDTGKYINLTNHAMCSSYIIQSSELIGLTEEEQTMIMIIARYHENGEPTMDDADYLGLGKKNRVAAAKLIAIIQLANSLDASHKQKLDLVSVRSEEGNFILRVRAGEDFLLEHWMFQKHSEFFRAVFGLQPELKMKRGNM